MSSAFYGACVVWYLTRRVGYFRVRRQVGVSSCRVGTACTVMASPMSFYALWPILLQGDMLTLRQIGDPLQTLLVV